MSVFDWLRGQAKAFEHRLGEAERLGEVINAKLDTVLEQTEKFDNAIASLYERALNMEKDINSTLDGSTVTDFSERIDNVLTEISKTVDGFTKEDARIWKAIERIESRINDRLNALATLVDSFEKDADPPGKGKKK